MIFLSLLLAFLPFAAALWPAPQSYTNGNLTFWLACDVSVDIEVVSVVPSYVEHGVVPQVPSLTSHALRNTSFQTNLTAESTIEAAVQRAINVTFAENFVPWRFHPRRSVFEPAANGTKSYISSIKVVQNATGSPYTPLATKADESYTLSITTDGAVLITGATTIGVLRGLETLTQLFYLHSVPGAGVYTNLAPVEITDAPMFSHRGLNLDVSRNYYPVPDIKRTIDALALNKFNVLHLHITDAQSWPLEIPALPQLAEYGAYYPGLTYSPQDILDLQIYGAERGVELVIEIDTPGHTGAIALAFPDLIAAYNVQPDWDTYSGEPPSGQLKLNSSAVDDFLITLTDDLLPRIKPYASYFHTGGDEINAQVYLLDDTVNSNSSAVLQPLLQRFIDVLHPQLLKYGLTPMVWEETLLDWNLTFSPGTVIQTWLADSSVLSAVQQGYHALAGDYNYWYLDCGRGQWLDFPPGESFQTYYPFADYCSPVKNWRLIYSYDPLEGIPANLSNLVLGGEVHMWSETADAINMDDLIWPRASAAGEVLWSGAKLPNGQNRSQVEASPRLAEMRERLVARGVKAGPVQMVWCNENEGDCSLQVTS